MTLSDLEQRHREIIERYRNLWINLLHLRARGVNVQLSQDGTVLEFPDHNKKT